jgi:hypothetical protein
MNDYRRRRPRLRPAAAQRRRINLTLDDETYDSFDREARWRGLTNSALLGMCITMMVRDDLFRAVLDTGMD